MTTEPRPIRDILAEMMRRERLGLMRPFWADAVRIDDAACEHIRRRADHLIRLLATEGVALTRAGEATPEQPPEASTIWRYGLVDSQTERVIREAERNRWEIVTITDGVETLEQTFTLAQAGIHAGLVLVDAPEARRIPGLGKQLAAQAEIYRVFAHGGRP